jgi:hypothetical protein
MYVFMPACVLSYALNWISHAFMHSFIDITAECSYIKYAVCQPCVYICVYIYVCVYISLLTEVGLVTCI